MHSGGRRTPAQAVELPPREAATILRGALEPYPRSRPVSRAVRPTREGPSSEPISSPVARPVEVDSLVETGVDDLSVREEPRLSAARVGIAPAGLRAWVVDGPVEADG
jgi:hypothetical protein